MEEVYKIMEAAAQKAVDYNRIEEGWFIRGVIDGMANKKMNLIEDPYDKDYEYGYKFAKKWDRM